MKGFTVFGIAVAIGVSLSFGSPDVSAGNDIIHDGEFNYLKKQYGEKWAKEDEEIDTKLAEIRKKKAMSSNCVEISQWRHGEVTQVYSNDEYRCHVASRGSLGDISLPHHGNG